MTTSTNNCLICGALLVYSDAPRDVVCAVCGKPDRGTVTCEAGHYVCDSCHRAGGVSRILKECRTSTSTDPIRIAQEVMADDAIYQNGPEHHTLAGAALLCAYKNAGGAVDYERALNALEQRSVQVPGGACGYWGVCGAAISAGQFYSIITQGTPLTPKQWGDSARLVARILERLADIGGPRCCKRTCFTSIAVAAEYVQETLGVTMDLPESIRCTFMPGNKECLKSACPYFPK